MDSPGDGDEPPSDSDPSPGDETVAADEAAADVAADDPPDEERPADRTTRDDDVDRSDESPAPSERERRRERLDGEETAPAEKGEEDDERPQPQAPVEQHPDSAERVGSLGPDPGEDEDDDGGWRLFVYDVVSSVVAVALVGLLLFAVSGVWPPLVAIESPSMTPNMKTGDLVFVMEERRFPGPGAQGDSGVVTARAGAETGHVMFQRPGDVIVYRPNGLSAPTPIIHRAMFWVDKGENWYDKANKQYIGGAQDCGDLTNCPAPHAGFVTKGDANGRYDQVRPNELSTPVKPEWVVGTAERRMPELGWLRLRSNEATAAPVTAATAGNRTAATGQTGPAAGQPSQQSHHHLAAA
jgi:signal peptidase